MSISVFITLRELRPKYRFAGGFKPRHGHRIPDLYSKRLLRIFYSCTRVLKTLEHLGYMVTEVGGYLVLWHTLT